MSVKLDDLSARVDHVVMAVNVNNVHEDDLHLPASLQIPMETVEHMEAMENALLDNDFRRTLVCIMMLQSITKTDAHRFLN